MKLPFANFIKAHHISRAALCAGAVVAAIVFFVAGAGLRLLWGPVSLGPLRGTLAGAIHEALPGIDLDYDQAAIEWTRDQGRVNLVVLGARIRDAQGHVVIRAPKAAIGLAAAPFLHGEFVIKRITLVGVEFSLVRFKDGRIRLGNQKDAGNDDVIGRIRDIIDARGGQSSSLESFAVRNARMGLSDEVTGLHMMSSRANLVLRSRGRTIGTTFDADVTLSGHTAHVTADLTLPSGNGPVQGRANFTGLDLRGLGANTAMFSGVKDIAVVLSASTQFRMRSTGRIEAAAFDITARGEVPYAAMQSKALHITSLRLVGRYDGAANRLALTTADLDAKEARAHLKGGGTFYYDAGGKLERVKADLSGENIALNMPGVFPQPVNYRSLKIESDYLTGPRQFEITKLNLFAAGFALEGSGTVTLNDNGSPGLVAKARIPAMPVRALLRYWPIPVAPGAREWIDGNIFAGDIGPLEAQTNFAPGMLDQDILPEESLTLTFAMKDIEGNYVTGLTRATGVTGDAVLTGDTFKASFTSGRIGPLSASRGTALIPNLHQRGTAGRFGVHIEGAMPDVMTLIDMKPLNYPTKFGIDPKTTGGRASADLMFSVPMLADLPVDDVGISVKAAVSDFAVTLGGKTRLTEGAVNFEIDNSHLHQTGMINLADARLNVDWTEDFRTKDDITTRLTVKGPMTEGGRLALNIGLMRYLRGTVPISADITGHRGSLRHADVSVDFTPATLSVPIVNLEKTPGQPASGRIGVNFAAGNVVQDQTIRISGPVLNLNGTADYDRNGELKVLNFPSVRMGPLNDLSFVFSRGSNGDEYLVRGRSMDGSKIGRTGSNEQPGGAGGSPPDDTPSGKFHISAKLDRLAMRAGVSIMPFSFDLAGIGNRPSALALSGNVTMGAKSTPIAANLEAGPTGRKVTLTSSDAGMLARGVFAFESMRGGELFATVNLPGQAGDAAAPGGTAPDFTGMLTIKNFQMVNQSLISRLFSAASLTGFGDLMGSDGIGMEEWNMPFSSKNNVISINGSRAVGRGIGASADGYIDRPHNSLALKGTLVPAYGLNSVLSNIPLLGDLLASKKGEGIFGVTYSMTGNADQPNISTNPLSMLTPGILRRIFEGHIPTGRDAPSNMVAPPRGDVPNAPAPKARPQEPAPKPQTQAQEPTPKPPAN
ncbi:MAG TPA: AsmA-like C-terminal domain-containing protein [Rhizomicrobium sp.]|nr:AsmA-like C-terminal domain-containing protein [Rhizomicrobium sp.]